MKLLPSRRVLFTLYNHAPCHCMQSHIRKVHSCLSVNCHLHLWQNDRDLLRATAVIRGGTDTKMTVSTESEPRRRKLCRRVCRDSNPRPFSHESCALTTEVTPRVAFVTRAATLRLSAGGLSAVPEDRCCCVRILSRVKLVPG